MERVEYLQDMCSSVSLDAFQKLDELEFGNNNDVHLEMREQEGDVIVHTTYPAKQEKM